MDTGDKTAVATATEPVPRGFSRDSFAPRGQSSGTRPRLLLLNAYSGLTRLDRDVKRNADFLRQDYRTSRPKFSGHPLDGMSAMFSALGTQ